MPIGASEAVIHHLTNSDLVVTFQGYYCYSIGNLSVIDASKIQHIADELVFAAVYSE